MTTEPQPWAKRVDAITLFVEDLAGAKAFYQRAFGLPVFFEDDSSVVFDFGNAVVNLLRTSSAIELVAPATPGGAGADPRSSSPWRSTTSTPPVPSWRATVSRS
jgi:catechol 2,3-dioxygenase-like lactoylglutathione lyase family enzyme